MSYLCKTVSLFFLIIISFFFINNQEALAQSEASETISNATPIATMGSAYLIGPGMVPTCAPMSPTGAGYPCDAGVRFNTYNMLLSDIGVNPGVARKELITNSFAILALKILLRQFTTDLVSWINSGFQGNPSFIQDPKLFLEKSTDRTIGNFIQDSRLNFLCEPFRINIKLALGLQYSPFQDQIGCRLSDIFNNSEDAYNNFINGDFIGGGGWKSWLAITTVPQNNQMGAMLVAQNQMQAEISGANGAAGAELNWGGGFLSMKQCVKKTKDADGKEIETYGYKGDPSFSINTSPISRPIGSSQTSTSTASGLDNDFATTIEEKCDIVTPGAALNTIAEKSWGMELDALNMADDINEIVGALANSVITTVINKGYAMIQKEDISSDNPNWRNELMQTQSSVYNNAKIGEANPSSYNITNMNSSYNSGITGDVYSQGSYATPEEEAALKNDKTNMLAYIDGQFRKSEQIYYDNYYLIYKSAGDLIKEYDFLTACYNSALSDSNKNLTSSERSDAENVLEQATSTVMQLKSVQIALLPEIQMAQNNLNSLNSIYNNVSAAYDSQQIKNESLKLNSITPYLHEWTIATQEYASSTLNTLNSQLLQVSDDLLTCQDL